MPGDVFFVSVPVVPVEHLPEILRDTLRTNASRKALQFGILLVVARKFVVDITITFSLLPALFLPVLGRRLNHHQCIQYARAR
jgi:hypothetical protein